MIIECRNCGHGAHGDDCDPCRNNYRSSCRVFAPDWEALQAQLTFFEGAIHGMRSILGVEVKDLNGGTDL